MPTNFTTRTHTGFIVVHCSATPPSMNIGAADIRRWHKAQGWLDIGYHYVIRRDGTIEPGREESAQGAHVEGYNHTSVGICIAGGLSEKAPAEALVSSAHRSAALAQHAENNFTPEQFASLLGLILKMQVKYPLAVLQGHRDFPNVHKDCPSFDVREWWKTQLT